MENPPLTPLHQRRSPTGAPLLYPALRAAATKKSAGKRRLKADAQRRSGPPRPDTFAAEGIIKCTEGQRAGVEAGTSYARLTAACRRVNVPRKQAAAESRRAEEVGTAASRHFAGVVLALSGWCAGTAAGTPIARAIARLSQGRGFVADMRRPLSALSCVP